MVPNNIAIYWFRNDLRLDDNPAFSSAIKNHNNVLPIYIVDNVNYGEYGIIGARAVWLHYALISLKKTLNGNLSVYAGDPLLIILDLVKKYQIKAVYWNRVYDSFAIKRDTLVKSKLCDLGIEVHSFKSSLLYEPWEIKNNSGLPYKVFTPFYKSCLEKQPSCPGLAISLENGLYDIGSLDINNLNLLPKSSWYKKLIEKWDISEEGAHIRLKYFLEDLLVNYRKFRDFPFEKNTSRLSPYLHFGQISPQRIWSAAQNFEDDAFRRQLIWREFSYYCLYHNPELYKNNVQSKFNNFPWCDNEEFLLAWQQGKTGVPLVDAGMRELWQTGYMHNRVRMVVASFLVKNLLQDWRKGFAWFWECLFDADLANNSFSWQWTAGCGFDAAPYFRIFNPSTQANKFDAMGQYIKYYVPELCDIPNNYLFDIDKLNNVRNKNSYPNSIIDLSESRKKALILYNELK